MLDRPGLVEAELIGEFHLVERVVVDLVLRPGVPGFANGKLVEDAEFHGAPMLARWGNAVGAYRMISRSTRSAICAEEKPSTSP